MDLYPYLASLAFALLLTGYALRARGTRRHAILMGTGMAIDLALVLALEGKRDAVATAFGGTLTAAQTTHVACSTLAVVLYIPVFTLGLIRLLNASPANAALRRWHRRLGYAALAFRSAGFLFMFSIIGRTHG